MLQPEIKVSSRLAKNTLGTFRGCQDCKLLKVLEILNPFFFFFFPLRHHRNHKIPSNEPFVRLPPDGADRGINQTHANIISGQAEIGWGEREKLNMEAYLFLHNFVSFLLAVRD